MLRMWAEETKKTNERMMSKCQMLHLREMGARATSTSRPCLKTSQYGNYRPHDPHPLLPYHYLPSPTRRPPRESGRGRRVGDRHPTYRVSSRPSPPSAHLSNPRLSPSPRPASPPPPPRSSSPPKSSPPRLLPEYRPPTRPTIRPSSPTHCPTSHRLQSGTCRRR